LKVEGAEKLLQSGIEEHTFEPTNVTENFREDALTVGKNKTSC